MPRRHSKDYDEALQGLDPIHVTVKGEEVIFAGDPDAGMVIEWYVYNTSFDPTVNQGEKLEHNWRLIFGDKQYERFIELGAGGRVLDALYSDLLDWWHIVRTPKGEVDGGLPDEVWEQIPPSARSGFRQYVIGLEDRIEELEDELGLNAEDREDAPVGEAQG